ncbi:MAG TPA: cysteine desulfurase, partial [Phycisphaerales bacterium]|nr:cysteine desulfurase [Phycisphaerales bacterium]
MSTLEGSQTHSATYAELSQCARSQIREIQPGELADQLASGLQLLDVRDFDETASGVIEGALVTPRGRLEKLVETIALDHDADVVLYCESGKRSALAAQTLGSMGFSRVRSLAGGIEAWREAGHPIRTGTMELATPEHGAPASPTSAVVLSDWDSIRSDYPITTARIECTDGLSRPLIYLDHAATTHPPATALQAYLQFLGLEYSNVHRATHSLARSATDRFEKAYETCANFIGGNLDDGCVVFTSNTTHACDLVAHVVAHLPGKVVVTDLEHHSNDLPHRGRSEVIRIGLDAGMCLDMSVLEEVLRTEQVKLVAVTGAANVTGWMPPIHEIAELAHRHGALICVDGAQLMAHAPVDVRPHDDPGHIDFITAAGHKMYAPFGIGFLYGPRTLFDEAPPYLPGGGTASTVESDSVEWLSSPDRHQGGTPNVAG